MTMIHKGYKLFSKMREAYLKEKCIKITKIHIIRKKIIKIDIKGFYRIVTEKIP